MENHLKNWVFSIAMFNDQRVSSKPTAQPQRIFYPQPCRHLPEGFRSSGGSLVQLMPWGFSNAQRRQQKTIGIFCWITADLGDWWTGDQLYLAVGHRWVTVGSCWVRCALPHQNSPAKVSPQNHLIKPPKNNQRMPKNATSRILFCNAVHHGWKTQPDP